MAFTVNASGTQSTTVPTEHTLKDETSPGGKTFVLFLDLNALANDDVLEVRVYAKVLTGGTLRVAQIHVLADAQGADNAIFFTVPIVGFWNVKFTINQTAGTSRSVPWELLEQ